MDLEEDPAKEKKRSYFSSLIVKDIDWKQGNLLFWSLFPGSINLFQSVDKDNGKQGLGHTIFLLPFLLHHIHSAKPKTGLRMSSKKGPLVKKVQGCLFFSLRPEEIPAQCAQHHFGHFGENFPSYSLPGSWE